MLEKVWKLVQRLQAQTETHRVDTFDLTWDIGFISTFKLAWNTNVSMSCQPYVYFRFYEGFCRYSTQRAFDFDIEVLLALAYTERMEAKNLPKVEKISLQAYTNNNVIAWTDATFTH